MISVGDVYKSTVSLSEFTVAAVSKDTITVDVSRRVIDRKTNEVLVEHRTRIVERSLWNLFSKCYEPL